MLERNSSLKEELEALNRHAEVLTGQNRELQVELEGFVATDEVVKRNLDRKDKIVNLRSQVDDVIQKSMMEMRQHSPARSRSPVVERTHFVSEVNTSFQLYQSQRQ